MKIYKNPFVSEEIWIDFHYKGAAIIKEVDIYETFS